MRGSSPASTSPSRSRRGRTTVPARPDAVVLGSGVNLIEVVRSLALVGIRSQVVPSPHEPARLSRHARAVIFRDWANPHLGDEESFVAELVEYGERQPAKLPLLFTSDEALLLVSAHREELDRAFRFVIAPHELVLDCVDKGRFAELAQQLDLAVPPTLVVRPRPGMPPPDITELGLPIVLKPQRRDYEWHTVLGTRGKAVHLRTLPELAAVWPVICELGKTILLQRAIPGREDRIESYHVYVDEVGRLAGEYTGKKIRTLPAQYGHTTSLVIEDEEDVRSRGRELIACLGLVGVAKFDFKRDECGQLYLLEVNPRFQLWHHPGARAGVNIPDLVHADLTGRERPVLGSSTRVSWCHPDDWTAGRHAGLGALAWARWARRCEAKAFWAWDDPLPLMAAGLRRIRR